VGEQRIATARVTWSHVVCRFRELSWTVPNLPTNCPVRTRQRVASQKQLFSVIRRRSGLQSVTDGQTPLEFEIKFFLLTEFADKNVGVYEKDSGGEGPELGLLRQAYCFNKTAILPRDYYGLGYEDVGARNGEEKVDRIKEIARHIAFADDLDDEQTMLELRGLIATAQNDGIDITEHELTEFLDDEIANRNTNDPEYSWVHLALFRRFEEAGQCHSWFDEQELRDTVNYVSLGSTVQWDYIIDTDELR